MAGKRDTYDATEEVDVMAGDDDEDFTPSITADDDDETPDPRDDEDEDDESLEADADDDDSDPDEDADEGDDGGEDQEDPEDDLGPIDPPANWPQQEQEFFKELPPALQHAYLDRARHMMADYTRKTQEVARVRQGYAELERTISPHVQKWALNGMGPSQAIQQLIALSDFATERPQEFLQYFANLRGVDLNALANQKAQADEYIDPQVHALRQQLSGVQAQLNQTVQQQQAAQQAAQRQQYVQTYQAVDNGIENFASQTDQNGKPLYPYFNELEEDMALEISSGRAQNLHEAYERAKWSNPYTRSKLLAQTRARDNARARQRMQEARYAASSLSGASAPQAAFSPEGLGLRDLIEATSSGLL